MMDVIASVMTGLSAKELEAVGMMVVDQLKKQGHVWKFEQEESELDLSKVTATGPVRARLWAKTIAKGEVDYTKDNGYAFTGGWLRLRDVPKLPDGTLFVVGRGGDYALMKAKSGTLSGLTFGALKGVTVDGATCLATSEMPPATTSYRGKVAPLLECLNGLGY